MISLFISMLTKLTINLLQKYKQKFEDMSIISGPFTLMQIKKYFGGFWHYREYYSKY